MAQVYWPNIAKGYNNTTKQFQDFGFDLRNIILEETAFPFSSTASQVYVIQTSAYQFIGGDTYFGTFGPTSMTVTSFSREYEEKILGEMTGLNVDFLEVVAAAKTPDMADDMALWARAFSGDDVLIGSGTADRLEGFDGNDQLLAGAGNDILEGGFGLDTLLGGNGNDRLYGHADRDVLTGGRGADWLYGGGDADVFVFASIKDSTTKSSGRDTIYDFSSKQQDKIELKAIDANSKKGGNQAFKFIDKQDFHKKAGELQWEKVKSGVYVYGDTNGDGKADFSIFLKGLTKVSKGDFFL